MSEREALAEDLAYWRGRAERDSRRYESVADALHKAVLRAEAAERLLADAEQRGAARVAAAVEAVADRWDGYGHGVYNVHMEEHLPCSTCDLLAQLRAALATGAAERVRAEEGEPNIGDTCCGKCPGGTCCVDQVTGA